jgi:hypothetical protein
MVVIGAVYLGYLLSSKGVHGLAMPGTRSIGENEAEQG